MNQKFFLNDFMLVCQVAREKKASLWRKWNRCCRFVVVELKAKRLSRNYKEQWILCLGLAFEAFMGEILFSFRHITQSSYASWTRKGSTTSIAGFSYENNSNFLHVQVPWTALFLLHVNKINFYPAINFYLTHSCCNKNPRVPWVREYPIIYSSNPEISYLVREWKLKSSALHFISRSVSFLFSATKFANKSQSIVKVTTLKSLGWWAWLEHLKKIDC